MRAVIQRVAEARVTVDGGMVAGIGPGLLVLLGVGTEDGEADALCLAERTAHLRIFEDDGGKLNLSLLQAGGEVLVVSQFTLYADVWQGRRPGFGRAAGPGKGDALYRKYVASLRDLGVRTATGEFGARMLVSLVNDGPVTVLMDSERTF
ncbi:MAG: D-aminoacyl-tRNA deacylase [bacterium]|nr:D-aminoacyl-tRNA deacylase [bacterium]